MIGYDPPANAAPNVNDPQGGDATVDAGMFYVIFSDAVQCSKGLLVNLIRGMPGI